MSLKKLTSYIESLCQLKSFVENHPELPKGQFSTSLCYYTVRVRSKEEMMRLAKVLGHCEKVQYGDIYTLRRDFKNYVSIDIDCPRQQICERIVVGKRHIREEYIPAHDEEIVEWNCPPLMET